MSFQITKEDVDGFKPKLTIPSCLMYLEWTGDKDIQPQRLCHKVILKGAKSPAFFHIQHDPQAVGMYNIMKPQFTLLIGNTQYVCPSYIYPAGANVAGKSNPSHTPALPVQSGVLGI